MRAISSGTLSGRLRAEVEMLFDVRVGAHNSLFFSIRFHPRCAHFVRWLILSPTLLHQMSLSTENTELNCFYRLYFWNESSIFFRRQEMKIATVVADGIAFHCRCMCRNENTCSNLTRDWLVSRSMHRRNKKKLKRFDRIKRCSICRCPATTSQPSGRLCRLNCFISIKNAPTHRHADGLHATSHLNQSTAISPNTDYNTSNASKSQLLELHAYTRMIHASHRQPTTISSSAFGLPKRFTCVDSGRVCCFISFLFLLYRFRCTFGFVLLFVLLAHASLSQSHTKPKFIQNIHSVIVL